MKKLILCFFILLTSIIAQSQFAIIDDTDGHSNVRSQPKIGNNIIAQLQNGHMVFCLGNSGNWTNIDFTKDNKDGFGYIYSNRYKPISDYPTIPLTQVGDSSATLSKDSISITITKGTFNKNNHRITYFRDDKEFIELIDSNKIWGTDGEIPRYQYLSMTVKIGKRVFPIPASALRNLYEPSLSNTLANFDNINKILYIQSMNSDGAGGYFVIWKIEKGIYKERFIAYGF